MPEFNADLKKETRDDLEAEAGPVLVFPLPDAEALGVHLHRAFHREDLRQLQTGLTVPECVEPEDCGWANEVVNLLDLARLGRKTAFVPAPDLTPQVATVREFGQERGSDHV